MILIVDDEIRYMDSYKEELKLSGYDFSVQTDVDAALRYFEENAARVTLLILDIMMAPGDSFESDPYAQKGLRTGVLFYRRIREVSPNLPIIILTNVTDDDLVRIFDHEENYWLYRKVETLPFELVKKISEILAVREKREF